MNTVQLLIVIVLSGSTVGQLSYCYTTEQFKDDVYQYVSPDINIDQFLDSDLPEPDSEVGSTRNTGLPILGAGGFGRIYKVNLLSINKQHQTPAALKVIRYAPDKKRILENEVSFMQHHSIANPLYFLRYYGCINNPNDPLTAFLINEELDADLDNEVFKTWIREKIDIVAYLETILQMSYSVKIVHELGMNHFDIKPDNYMLITKSGTLRNKEDNYFLIKLIDYGLVGKVGKREQRGTPHFMDPLLLSEKSGHHNDIYSLGLTIYCILKSCSEIRLNRLQDLIENQGMTLMNGRVDTMTDRLNEEIRDLKANNQNASIVAKLEQLYSIIISMVSSDKQDRPNIQTIISDLQGILQQLEPTSLYLTENNAELKEFFYPSFDEGQEPFIWDDGSTNLDDEISNLDEVTSLSNPMQQHESIINNFNLIQNVHDGNEINFDHLQDSMQIEKNMEMVSAQTVRVNIDFNRPVVFDDRYGLVNIGDIGRPLETEISEASSKNMIRI